ncbi:hypothetical protein [Streptomyces sp. B1I3]|uniref:hypothetical protein n=1 Tax=Streptomyces sp. B1I3 TaxID=3042264 RepID=UPI00277D3B82|nr:hypothetical protein [Streptomyces sp. B1I3]MDQ0797880.1 hypothetical protein [Streptomyces sp. B1I3]
MNIEIQDTEGRGGTLEVVPATAGGAPGVGILARGPSVRASWSCSPAAARELAAALVRAAAEAESSLTEEPVTVKARDLQRGDVRDGNRFMTVEAVRTDGANVQVTWSSGGGRSWSQMYAAEADITLRRRLRPGN